MRAHPQAFFGVVSQRLCVGPNGVAGANKLERGKPGIMQFGETIQVAVAHTAASDNCERNLVHVCSFFRCCVVCLAYQRKDWCNR